MDEVVNVPNLDIMDFSRGIQGLVQALRTQDKMSEDSIVLCLTALSEDEEKFDQDFTLRSIISRRRLFELRDKIQEEFKSENPKITKKDFEDYIRLSNAPIKSILAA